MATPVTTGLDNNTFGLRFKGVMDPGPVEDEFDNVVEWLQQAAQALIDIGGGVAATVSQITIPPFVLKFREQLPAGSVQDEFDNIAAYLSQIYDAIQVLKAA